MDIQGLQKLTLLDYPGHVACTVFLGGCDLRCPFCHNAELIGAAPALMGEEELLAFLKKRQGILEGVAFTGGEPLLRPDLPALSCAPPWWPSCTTRPPSGPSAPGSPARRGIFSSALPTVTAL